MAEEKFDVIIVGGGITGCVAAYLLAQAEMEVLVVERAEEAGQKAVTGGRGNKEDVGSHVRTCDGEDLPRLRRRGSRREKDRA